MLHLLILKLGDVLHPYCSCPHFVVSIQFYEELSHPMLSLRTGVILQIHVTHSRGLISFPGSVNLKQNIHHSNCQFTSNCSFCLHQLALPNITFLCDRNIAVFVRTRLPTNWCFPPSPYVYSKVARRCSYSVGMSLK